MSALLMCLVCAAPLPAERPPQLVGLWKVYWGKVSARVEFLPDGSYRYLASCDFEGKWELVGFRLSVQEWPSGQYPPTYSHRYSVGLRRTAEGGYEGVAESSTGKHTMRFIPLKKRMSGTLQHLQHMPKEE